MKLSVAYSSLVLLGAVSAQEACVEGKRVTVSPGYTVEYRCGIYRLGTTHKNIQSHDECAALCRDASRSVCTYHAGTRACIVGDENGKEGKSAGATYMVKVEEPEEKDPFAEEDDDPFNMQTCEEERESWLKRETTLKTQLTQCQADLAAASSASTAKQPPPTLDCGVPMWGQKWYDRKLGVNLADCKKLCQTDSKCLSYSNNNVGGNGSPNNCYLYDKVTKDVPKGTYPNFAQWDKNC